VTTILADVGNTRIKLALWGGDRTALEPIALDVDTTDSWETTLAQVGWLKAAGQRWHISSVRPEAADRLERLIERLGGGEIVWYRSAADVPVVQKLGQPERVGADRALAVRAAVRLVGRGPLAVVMAGTAVTVEKVDEAGCWLGGAIAPGIRPLAEALHRLTAQLPLIDPEREAPAWSNQTEGALAAGLRWGVVGMVRELLERQGLDRRMPVVWSGGDAEWLAREISWRGSRVVRDLVLVGLGQLADERGQA
jgi:type III pantothenate kinase